MGLDISHIKPTLVIPVDPGDHIFVEDWHLQCNIPIDTLLPYIQDIPMFNDPPRKGFYFIKVGYQRKFMISSFYEDFQNGYMYGTLQDFQKAYNYIDKEFLAENVQTRLNNFQINFIDKFEPGLSLMEISW